MTVQCTRDGQFVVVVARDVTQPPIDVNSISLLEPSDAVCSPVDGTSAFVIFQFPVTACGTALKVGGAFNVGAQMTPLKGLFSAQQILKYSVLPVIRVKLITLRICHLHMIF